MTRIGGPPDVEEKKPYLSTPNNISPVFYPGVYPIMARGDIARTYRSVWLTTSSSPRWLVLHPRTSELLAIFTTVPPYIGYVERSVNRTDVVQAIGVDEELCECGENVERG